MAAPTTEPFDPLGGVLPEGAERVRQAREADNVLGSYFRASDLLAEALQNAADAIDHRSRSQPTAPRAIDIAFDGAERCFAVADTGTGMSRSALDIVFRPSITLKSGPLALSKSRRWRGEKGVGLSFLMFACDDLQFQTCDGKHRYDIAITGAYSWVNDPEKNPMFKATLTTSDADKYLGSKRYTIVTIAKIDPEDRFDRDLFAMSIDELEWVLRTNTAVGNTAPLFAGIGIEPPDNIDVTLRFRPAPDDDEDDASDDLKIGKAEGDSIRDVPYRYATPEDLLARAEFLGVVEPVPVYDLEDLKSLSVRKIRSRLANAAVRFIAEFETADETPVYFYVFAMEGNTMDGILRALENHKEVTWTPRRRWQGFWVATRDMPTGIPLRGGVLPTRAYEQRVFGLLQRDDLKLDLGRKSLAGGTAAAFNRIIRTAWKEDLRWAVERIPRSAKGRRAGALELERRVRAARALEDLDADVPFLKVPDRRSGVAAVFHELLGQQGDILPELLPLTTGVFDDEDALVFAGSMNGHPPMHVVFGLDQGDVLAGFDADSSDAELVELAVVWTLETDNDDAVQIEIEELTDDVSAEDEVDDGATHVLHFGGLGGRERPLRVAVLSDLLAGG